MTKSILQLSILGGLTIILVNYLLYLSDVRWMLNNYWYFNNVLYLIAMWVGTARHRTMIGGTMTWKEGFTTAWKTFVVMSAFEAIWTYLLWNFVEPNISAVYRDLVIENAEWNCQMADIDPCLQLQDAKKMKPKDYRITFFGMIANYVYRLIAPGAVFAGLMGLILKREKMFDKKTQA